MEERRGPSLSLGRALHVLLSLDPRVLKRALHGNGNFDTPEIVTEALESLRSHAAKSTSKPDGAGDPDPLLASLAEQVVPSRSRHVLGLLTWILLQPGCASFPRHIGALFAAQDKRQLLSACVIARHVAEAVITRGSAASSDEDSDPAREAARAVAVAEVAGWVRCAVGIAGSVGAWKPTRLCCAAYDCAVACTLCLADAAAPLVRPLPAQAALSYVAEDRALPSSAGDPAPPPASRISSSNSGGNSGGGREPGSDEEWRQECAAALLELRPQLLELLKGRAELSRSQGSDGGPVSAEMVTLGAEGAAELLAQLAGGQGTPSHQGDPSAPDHQEASVAAQCWSHLGPAALLDVGKWTTLLHAREAEWWRWLGHGPPTQHGSDLQKEASEGAAAEQYNLLVGAAVSILAQQLPRREATAIAAAALSSGAKGVIFCLGGSGGGGGSSASSRIGSSLLRWLLAQGCFPSGSQQDQDGANRGSPAAAENSKGRKAPGTDDAAAAVLPGILELLGESDGVSGAAVSLAAELLLQLRAGGERPWWSGSAVLGYGPVEALLRSDSSSARANALDLLHALADARLPHSPEDLDGSSLVSRLAEALSDGSLQVRQRAARLLGRLPRDAAFRPLVHGAGDADARARSAAADGFRQVLSGTAEEHQAFGLLLWALSTARDAPGSKQGGGGGKAKAARTPADRSRDELQRVARQWAEEDLGAVQRLSVTRLLTAHLTANPGDLDAVALLSSWSSWLSSGAPLALVLGASVAELRRQPLQPSSTSARDDKELIRRLCPLLMLKVLLLGALDNTENPDVYGAHPDRSPYPSCSPPGPSSAAAAARTPEEAEEEEPLSAMGIADFLFDRLCNSNEYNEVRLLSAELSGRLQPDFLMHRTSQLLSVYVSSVEKGSLKAVRALCVVMCSMLAARGELPRAPGHHSSTSSSTQQAAEGPPPDEATSERGPCVCGAPRVADLLMDVLGCDAFSSSRGSIGQQKQEDEEGSEELRKTHMGAMDCLAMMCRAELMSSAKQQQQQLQQPWMTTETRHESPLIEEIDTPEGLGGSGLSRAASRTGGPPASELQHATLDSVLKGLLEELPSSSSSSSKGPHPPPSRPLQAQICMANVLIMLSQRLEPSALPGFEALVMRPMGQAVSGMLSSSGGGRELPNEEQRPLLVPCLQVLFTGTHTLAAAGFRNLRCNPLMELSLAAMEETQGDGTRVAGAKLLAAVLTLPEEVLQQAASAILDRARSVVRKAAALDRSPELRDLCGKLSACIT